MIQGWTPDFIPLVAQESIDKGFIDEVVPVSAETSFASSGAGTKEGIFYGISCGATFAAALDVAQRAGPKLRDHVPDTGERYLSTPLFGDIEAEMTEEEWAMARSSPSAVLGVKRDRRTDQAGPGPPRTLSHFTRFKVDALPIGHAAIGESGELVGVEVSMPRPKPRSSPAKNPAGSSTSQK